MRKIYESFGILNLFCPYRPNGSYMFRLDIYEEKLVLKMLGELCKAEGWGNMTEIKLNGKSIDSINSEFISGLPDTGVFEGTYVCPPEKVKMEVRTRIGVKYLDWEA